MKSIKLLLTVFLLLGIYSLSQAYPEESNRLAVFTDTTDTTEFSSAELPLSPNSFGKRRPKFDTIHLIIGIGGLFSDLSSLSNITVEQPNLTIPISIYMRIPFKKESSKFNFTAGGDLGIYPSFNAFIMYQSNFRIILGLGAGRITHHYKKENYSTTSEGNPEDLVINIEQSYGFATIGISIIPKQLELITTLPIKSRIKTDFEGKNYSIRFPGPKISLLISLR